MVAPELLANMYTSLDHGAEALAGAFDELFGAFRSQTPLTFVL